MIVLFQKCAAERSTQHGEKQEGNQGKDGREGDDEGPALGSLQVLQRLLCFRSCVLSGRSCELLHDSFMDGGAVVKNEQSDRTHNREYAESDCAANQAQTGAQSRRHHHPRISPAEQGDRYETAGDDSGAKQREQRLQQST